MPPKSRRIYAILYGVLALAPALVVATLFQFRDSALLVLGTELASPFGVRELVAAETSLFLPILGFLPLVTAFSQDAFNWRRWIWWLTPMLLVVPSALTAVIKGAGFHWLLLAYFAAASLWMAVLMLWAHFLKRLLGMPLTALIWSVFWMLGDLLAFVRDYLAVYLESAFLQIIPMLAWLMPATLGAQPLADHILLQGEIPWQRIIAMTVQGALLWLLLYWKAFNPQKSRNA